MKHTAEAPEPCWWSSSAAGLDDYAPPRRSVPANGLAGGTEDFQSCGGSA